MDRDIRLPGKGTTSENGVVPFFYWGNGVRPYEGSYPIGISGDQNFQA